MIQGARRHEVGGTTALLVEPVDPPAGGLASEEPLKQEIGERQGPYRRPFAPGRCLDDVGLECLCHWPDAVRRQMVRAVDQHLLDDQARLVIAVLVSMRIEAIDVGFDWPAALALEPAQQPHPFIVMARLDNPAADSADRLSIAAAISPHHPRPRPQEAHATEFAP